ncbi:hypothetical protein RY831_14500 [Noviherbaspirillum sp. CPCC 100848]|jgi:hypothetical protein|uniref:XRE family transcriptional regulator n=1 Tax=Noviherbaspirillum album TaxID=3080276 RepID=A0ABU6J9P1_9BURK|nr:hypothetical protein [Noviherbaspirillum sp. CPCC 100848]MEC4720369.1 hypothetical protein [Noviherbaspirillum sp. CPCC 100848]
MDTSEQATKATTTYNPSRLLDIVIDRLQLKNDAALARTLGVPAPMISKIRHRRLPIGASLLISMHEETGWSIRELRDLMGDRRQKFRISLVHFKPK